MIDYTDANILYRVYRGNSNFEVQLSSNFNVVCQGKSFVIDYNPYNLPHPHFFANRGGISTTKLYV